MSRTPGFIVPSAYSSKEELEKDLRRRDEASGFTPFEASDFTDNAIAHFGVKGMKWGVRRAPQPDNANYSKGQRDSDAKSYGSGGVKRINKRMNNGSSVEKARKQEQKFQSRRSWSLAAGLLAVRYHEQLAVVGSVAKALLKEVGHAAAYSVAKRAETKRGQAHAAETMGLPSAASTGPRYSDQNRKGVYNVTNL